MQYKVFSVDELLSVYNTHMDEPSTENTLIYYDYAVLCYLGTDMQINSTELYIDALKKEIMSKVHGL